MEWGRKPRGLGTWYVTEHMVRAMRAYGWTIIVGAAGPAGPVSARSRGRSRGAHRGARRRSRHGGAVPRLRRPGPAHDGRDLGRVRGVHLSGDGGLQVAALLLRVQFVGAVVEPDRRRRGDRRRRAHAADGRPLLPLHLVLLRLAPARCDVARDGVAHDPDRRARGALVRDSAHGICRVARGRPRSVRARAALHLHADVPVLGHLLPAREPPALAAVDRLDLAALARVRARPDRHLRQLGR